MRVGPDAASSGSGSARGLLFPGGLALCAVAGYFLLAPAPDGPKPRTVEPDGSAAAIRQHLEALRDSPDDARTHASLAALLATVGRLDEAARHFSEVVRIEPEQPEAHLNLGNTLARQQKYAEAIPHYRRAIELKPDYAKAHNNLAVALKETGRLAQAHRHLQEATRLERAAAETTEKVRSPGPAATGTEGRGAASVGADLGRLTTRSLESRRATERDLLDPRNDGWDSEVVAEQAGAQLGRLAALLGTPGQIEPALLDLASEDVSSSPLRPGKLTEAFRDASLVIRRGEAEDQDRPRPPVQGREGLARALRDLAAPFLDASDVHTHVKVLRVSLSDTAAGTTAYLGASGRTERGMVDQHVTLECRWARQEGEPLRLASIRAEDYQEIEARGPRWFADCTSAVLGGSPSFSRQLARGLNHWLPRIERVHSLHVFARHGIAVGDVNGDDLEDVYVCQPGGLPNRLYVQNADGTCRDASKEAGVDWLDHTSSALLVDLDNDGDQDLVAGTMFGLIVMENDSTGRFERRAVLSPADIDLQSLTAADYDGDGDLDLYICVDFSSEAAAPTRAPAGFVYHDANDGGANLLYRSELSSTSGGAGWTFTDVTKQTGLDEDNRRHSLAAGWEDYDGDGDPDLYVANDYGRNCLYRNDGGHFRNVAAEAGVVDSGSGMSVSWGDYNRDGWMDIYVGNMFSSAGNRITRQARFQPAAGEETRALYRRFAKGNSLFENRGDGTFREVGAEAGVELGRWAWSSVFADLNNDGFEDLLVANGYITTEDTGDL